ncbi:MAG: APC family permease [Candidatus Limivicinus sp.]|jgi:amino acid transporter
MKEKKAELQRKLTPFNVGALAFGCIIGWGAFVMPGDTFLPKAGPLGTAIAMLIAILLMIIISFNYGYMIRKLPVAGGEFKYTQVAFGDKHAFLCAWFMALTYISAIPMNATALALLSRNFSQGALQFGFHYVIADYDVYFGEILVAEIALLFFMYSSIRGVKVAGNLQSILVILLLGGVLVTSGAAIFECVTGKLSISPAFSPEYAPGMGVLAVVVVAPWAFCGFDTVPQSTEEFKFSTTKAQIVMIISIISGGLVYILLNTVTAVAVPSNYASWCEYITDAKSSTGISALPTFNAAYLLLGKFGVLLLILSVGAAILSGIVGQCMSSSRLVFSMAREEVLPKWFGKISEKYGTPVHSIAFVMGVSMLAPFCGRTVLAWLVDMASVGAAIGYGYTSAAALKFAYMEKNIMITITGVIGSLLSLSFLVLLLIPIPAFGCSLDLESYICLLIWGILGFIFYAKNRKKQRKIYTRKSE